MRVLQIHKFFYPHAGSETVLFHTRKLLEDRGHEVVDFAMRDEKNVDSPYAEYFSEHRDYVSPERPKALKARDAVASVYSFEARRQLRRLLRDFRPDIAHMHIIYHHLTLSVVDELAAQGVPSVHTLHDYKVGCPAYTLYRDGEPCSLCTQGPVENVAVHSCIKGSRAASVLAAAEARLARARHTYQKIDAYVAPSAFAGRVAVDAGVDPATVHVVPNFLPDEEIGEPPAALEAAPRFFFAGRLEEVKGVRDMLAVFATGEAALGTLVIAGAGGDLAEEVSRVAAGAENIEYLGRVTREEVGRQVRRSRAMLAPSRWHENNPMSVLEARAAGIPVITTDMGGLPEMTADGVDGFVVPRGDREALAGAIRTLAADAPRAAEMGRKGYARLLADNAPGPHYEKLMAAYESATARRAGLAAAG